jgi:endogenous inhibitor of DNA gyrase (YacG/DUF329 family)
MKANQESTCVQCSKKINFSKESAELWPFCSKRCKTIDLGQWLGEKYVINGPVGEVAEGRLEKDGEEDE